MIRAATCSLEVLEELIYSNRRPHFSAKAWACFIICCEIFFANGWKSFSKTCWLDKYMAMPLVSIIEGKVPRKTTRSKPDNTPMMRLRCCVRKRSMAWLRMRFRKSIMPEKVMERHYFSVAASVLGLPDQTGYQQLLRLVNNEKK